MNNYRRTKFKMAVKRTLLPGVENKFLFVLCPPYCGSTLLVEILSTSKSVSVNNQNGTKEGQKLPEVRPIMYETPDRWNEAAKFPWQDIRSVWLQYWDQTRPILLEKSPPNIMRAFDIQVHFQPAYFIGMVRNPYAHCESIIRRNSQSPSMAAEFVLKCLRYQKQNIEGLANAIFFKYEKLTSQPGETAVKLKQFLPELADLDMDRDYGAHNFKDQQLKIQNLNEEKIKNLTPQQMDEINTYFAQEKPILDYFEYELLEADSTR